MDQLTNKLAEVVLSHCQLHAISLYTVAKNANVSRSHMHKIMRKEICVGPEVASRIAESIGHELGFEITKQKD